MKKVMVTLEAAPRIHRGGSRKTLGGALHARPIGQADFVEIVRIKDVPEIMKNAGIEEDEIESVKKDIKRQKLKGDSFIVDIWGHDDSERLQISSMKLAKGDGKFYYYDSTGDPDAGKSYIMDSYATIFTKGNKFYITQLGWDIACGLV